MSYSNKNDHRQDDDLKIIGLQDLPAITMDKLKAIRDYYKLADGTPCTDVLWLMSNAYVLGVMHGKRQERKKKTRDEV